jgi:hypothetical protein
MTVRLKRTAVIAGIACVSLSLASTSASADEGGVSFWLPGQLASFAAVPGEPGWSLPLVYYHASASAGGQKHFVVGGNLVAGLDANVNLVFFAPTYTITEPLLGGQAAMSVVWAAGTSRVGVDAVVTGPRGNPVNLSRTDTVSGGSDLYPFGTLKWHDGKNNWITYVMGGIPTGAYQVGRLANLGLNHWSVDTGGGYTYLDSKKGHEFSIVGGFTYNWENPDTDYKNGIDSHLDWAASQFLNERVHVGAAGYVYYQLTGDSGSGATLGPFKSRVFGVGPQAGYFFPVGSQKGYVNLRGYWEFDAKNRAEGWNLWLTLSLPLEASR